MLILAGIVITGLLGIAGHWLTRWQQGRTQSTFTEYLKCYKANTIQSLMANLASSFTIYAATPEDIAGKALVMVLIGSYMAGYTFDSKLNKDKFHAKETITDLLDADGKY